VSNVRPSTAFATVGKFGKLAVRPSPRSVAALRMKMLCVSAADG
jgi:hypothetical protein